jgi:hypothetical protein
MTLSELHRQLRHKRSEIVEKMGAIVRQDAEDEPPANDAQETAMGERTAPHDEIAPWNAGREAIRAGRRSRPRT